MIDQLRSEAASGFNIPKGKLVLVIDDDGNFRKTCMSKLKRILTKLEPEEDSLVFVTAGSLEKFELILRMLEVGSRKGDLVYALVDLKLPATEGRDSPDQEPATRNGRDVCRKLREWNVPILLVSSAGVPEVDPVLIDGQMPFLPKEDFNDDRKVEEVTVQILYAKRKSPVISLEYCDVIESPVKERGQTRRLPLAFKAPSMRVLRNRILGKVKGEAAAVLLLGEHGVEFEQLAWLLFREIAWTGAEGTGDPRYRYIPFNCESGASPTQFLTEDPAYESPVARQPRFLFIENLHAIDETTLTQFCEALRRSPAVRIDGDRVVLTVHKGEGNGTERLLDLFCMGFDDFTLLEVPELSRKRPDDIAVYAEYFRIRRLADRQESMILFHERALHLIKAMECKRHFKDLSIFLDVLFRTGESSIITAKTVQSLSSGRLLERAADEVLAYIRSVDAWDERHSGSQWSPGLLEEMCSQLLVYRSEPDFSTLGEEQFYEELERILLALQQAKRLADEGKAVIDDLQRDGAEFWPWTRFPIGPNLLKHLQRHGLTVGLVPHEAKQ